MAGMNLRKGQPMDLTKKDPNLVFVAAGCGWDVRKTAGKSFDLDVSAFLLDETEKVPGRDSNLVAYFNNLTVLGGAVRHSGDNRTGEGDGDDETIFIDLSKLPAYAQKVVVTITIHEWKERQQTFGMVNNARVKVYKCNEKLEKIEELGFFDLSDNASTNTAVIMGEFYRHAGEWKFRAVGQGFDGGLEEMSKIYGVD